MSLSNPRQTNPATKFIEWSGSKGQFYFYDKEAKEEKYFDSPIYIIVLDQLSCVTGFSDPEKSGFYSNEVKNPAKEMFCVRFTKNNKIAIEGLWKDIKGYNGVSFTKSVYCALITGTKNNVRLECVNIKFAGSAIGAWIDVKAADDGNVIELNPSTEQLKKGTTIYYAPEITRKGKREDILEKCIDMDKSLQKFFEYRENRHEETNEFSGEKYTGEPSGINEEPPENDAGFPDEPDDLPF